ncbi:hypothetical protein [Phycicoccus flavus]|uniref:hypothetical protein n=1 Tax=Phycicoccus flavus TaxID=2502783 RepID=UPI00197BE808|nr:hypothetical protein [Phycicoccus flavus]
MVVIGVLLILLAVAAAVLLFLGTGSISTPVTVDIPGGSVEFAPVVLLVTGMVIITIFWFGWFLLRVGTVRAHRRRVSRREAEREAEEQRLAQEARMKEEVEARERELAEERRQGEIREARLRQEAEERAAEQHVSTETARRRAEVAEARAGDRPSAEAVTRGDAPSPDATDPGPRRDTTDPPGGRGR